VAPGCALGSVERRVLAAALKATSVSVLSISGTQTLDNVESPFELEGTYGRLRSPNFGPDGSLYLTTSNGGGTDQILKVTPGFGDERCRGSRPDPPRRWPR
jgi:glucose/arabinose dehydrogenase